MQIQKSDPTPKPIEIETIDGRVRRFRSVHEAVGVLHVSSRTIRRRIEDGASLQVNGYHVKVRYV